MAAEVAGVAWLAALLGGEAPSCRTRPADGVGVLGVTEFIVRGWASQDQLEGTLAAALAVDRDPVGGAGCGGEFDFAVDRVASVFRTLVVAHHRGEAVHSGAGVDGEQGVEVAAMVQVEMTTWAQIDGVHEYQTEDRRRCRRGSARRPAWWLFVVVETRRSEEGRRAALRYGNHRCRVRPAHPRPGPESASPKIGRIAPRCLGLVRLLRFNSSSPNADMSKKDLGT